MVSHVFVLGLDERNSDTLRGLPASWTGDDFDSVRGENTWWMGLRRGDWEARTVTHTVLTSTPEEFQPHARLDAYENEQRVLSKNWRHSIPRDHV